MRAFPTIQNFVGFLGHVAAGISKAEHRGLDKAGALIEAEARKKIGLENEGWAPLAPSTIERKTAAGHVGRISATDPLFATGELRASLSHEVKDRAVYIGTPDHVGVYQEIGTSRIPPRPFLSAAAHEHGAQAAKLAGHEVALAVAGKATR